MAYKILRSTFILTPFIHGRAILRRKFYSQGQFGFIFDIDGVIVRGKNVLPSALDAFRLLTDSRGNFQVPSLFVTNAGNAMRSSKAHQLSSWLGVNVEEDQVVMSHSPLKMFRQFHDKHVLINGQGPVKEIALNLGFTNVTTVDELCSCFPYLDVMDHERCSVAPCAFADRFPPVEAVVLFGEPVRWERSLQVITDVLMCNGRPNLALGKLPYPHLPVLACNMDLLWMAEALTPRFGHGCFLHALEGVYQKITGRELIYTALIGKPSEITYHHADHLLHQQARQLGISNIKTIYCIGDNPETDIYGGNMYNQYLCRHKKQRLLMCNNVPEAQSVKKKLRLGQTNGDYISDEDEQLSQNGNCYATIIEPPVDDDPEREVMVGGEKVVGDAVLRAGKENSSNGLYTDSCLSILVCTGVFSRDTDLVSFTSSRSSNHNHRDFVISPELKRPTHVVDDVFNAVKLAMQNEGVGVEDANA